MFQSSNGGWLDVNMLSHIMSYPLQAVPRFQELFDALNFAAFYLHEVLLDVPGGRVLRLGICKMEQETINNKLVALKMTNNKMYWFYTDLYCLQGIKVKLLRI